MARKFAVFHGWHNANKPNQECVAVYVADWNRSDDKALDEVLDGINDRGRAPVAKFPVSFLYDVKNQTRRAEALAKYLNSEAAVEAAMNAMEL